ncbi:MAG: DUF89 family protein [Clostridia bacterium]|nr:DUF89 family protein [Clostridia bacterium]
MNANVSCMICFLSKTEKAIRHYSDEDKKMACIQEMMQCLRDEGANHSAPYLNRAVDAIRDKYFPGVVDYGALKHRYNQYMLTKEGIIEERIRASEDRLAACVAHVCAGNYIDFGALDEIDESLLDQLLEKASQEKLPKEEMAAFRADLEKAKTLVYLTDNCGEVVLDKIFVKFLKEMYPTLAITVVVRGAPVMNDATMEDACEVGLTDLAPCVGNGSDACSTLMDEVSPQVKRLLGEADVIISKGMGNFEGLYGEGLNPYFMFLCKCELFVRRFGLEQFASVFAREDRIQMKF